MLCCAVIFFKTDLKEPIFKQTVNTKANKAVAFLGESVKILRVFFPQGKSISS